MIGFQKIMEEYAGVDDRILPILKEKEKKENFHLLFENLGLPGDIKPYYYDVWSAIENLSLRYANDVMSINLSDKDSITRLISTSKLLMQKTSDEGRFSQEVVEVPTKDLFYELVEPRYKSIFSSILINVIGEYENKDTASSVYCALMLMVILSSAARDNQTSFIPGNLAWKIFNDAGAVANSWIGETRIVGES